ncbi:unnamed protein product [Ectocarpus sp. 12 AP-2014]
MVSTLARFTIYWCCVAASYVVVLGMFKLATKEASDRDYGLFQLLLATLGLAQLASMMSNHEDVMSPSMLEINYGIIATVAAAAVARCYLKFVRGVEPRSVNMSGKVVIITGSNTGVGYETAKALVNMGAHVIMACRSEEKARKAIENITFELEAAAKAIRHNTDTGIKGKLTFMKLDLSSLAAVRVFVAEFKASKLGLDSLILNAGVMHGCRKVTEEGLEANLAVNYLGNFLLTTQLLPLLKQSPDGRVLCVNSSLHKKPEAFRFEDPMFDRDYNMFKAYANSKLALLMFAEELQQRLNREKSTVIVNSANPGIVMTDISRDMGWFLRVGHEVFKPFLKLFLKQPKAGAFTSVFAATTPQLRKSTEDGAPGVGGLYMSDCAPQAFNPAVSVDKSRKDLWQLSEEWVSAGSKKNR